MKAQHRKLDTRKALFIHCPQPLQRGLMALMGSIPSLAIDGIAVADDDWKEVLRQYPDSLVFVFSSNNCELEAMVRSIRRVNRRLPCLAITKSEDRSQALYRAGANAVVLHGSLATMVAETIAQVARG